MAFELSGVNFSHPGKDLFEDLDLVLPAGKFIGIIGPNGCGKTTLLDLICRHKRPRNGQIFLDGRPLAAYDKRALARRIALVPQNYTIHFSFSVEDVVRMGRYPHTPRFGTLSPVDLKLVEKVMADCDLLFLKDRSITTLSGGERQRVIFARALAQHAPVLVLDEATANLDVCHALVLLDRVRDLVRTEGRTVIAVFQDLNLASAYSQYLVILQSGRVKAVGPTKAVLTPESLKRVFDIRAKVTLDDFTGNLQVRYKRA